MQTEHSPFPTDETLAAYIDGRLDEETRKRVVEHMAECPECLDVVMGGREIETIGNSKILAAHSTSRWVLRTLAAVAAALAAVVFLTPLRQTFLQHRPSGVAALAEAAPPYRQFEGRLATIPYRPLKPAMRGGDIDSNAASEPEMWKTIAIANTIKEEAQKRPSAENLHALGVAFLLLGNAADAVPTLEKAAIEGTKQATVQD